MALEKITIEKAKEIAKDTGVKLAVVKGTDVIRFMKKKSDNLEEIDWNRFEDLLKKHNLAIYASGTWMKIMKDH